MTKLTVHKRRGKAFFDILKQERDGIQTISFDCQKNMVLPKVPDQAAYYSRQFYLYNFGIVQGSSKSCLTPLNVFLYVWTENIRPKRSNKIASAVSHRLNNMNLVGIMYDHCTFSSRWMWMWRPKQKYYYVDHVYVLVVVQSTDMHR